MIRQSFNHPTMFSYEIQAGCYQLYGSDGKMINREDWSTSISPGMTVTMRLSPQRTHPVSGMPFHPGAVRPPPSASGFTSGSGRLPPPPPPPDSPFSERRARVAPADPATQGGERSKARDGTTGLASMKAKPKVRRPEERPKYLSPSNLQQWMTGKKTKKRRPEEEPESAYICRFPEEGRRDPA